MENRKNEFQDLKEQVLSEAESFVKTEYEFARLRVIDYVSRLLGSLLLTLCIILAAFAMLTFCAAAAVFALGQVVPMWAACLIIGAVYLVLIPVLIACSKVLFTNPIIRRLSGLKSAKQFKYETLRAEGRVAVQRERVSGQVRLARAIYNHYTHLARSAWNALRGLFSK